MCSPPAVETCPRCGSDYVPPGATSRSDNATEVCPTCGIEEALRDAAGLPRVRISEWPAGSGGSVPYPQAFFDAIRGEYQAMAEAVGRSFAPGEDWMPTLLLEGRRAPDAAGEILPFLISLFPFALHAQHARFSRGV